MIIHLPLVFALLVMHYNQPEFMQIEFVNLSSIVLTIHSNSTNPNLMKLRSTIIQFVFVIHQSYPYMITRLLMGFAKQENLEQLHHACQLIPNIAFSKIRDFQLQFNFSFLKVPMITPNLFIINLYFVILFHYSPSLTIN